VHWRSIAVEVGPKAEICQGVEILLRADERFRVQWLAIFVYKAAVCKNCTEQLTFIVRVMLRHV